MRTVNELVQDRPLHLVQHTQKVADAVRYMAKENIGAVPVMDGNRLVGIFSERDVITRVMAQGLDAAAVSVAEVMTRKIVVASATESHESCLQKMKVAHCRHLPVVSGGDLVGMVSLRDLLMMDLDEKERNLEYLESYIYTIPPGTTKRYSHP